VLFGSMTTSNFHTPKGFELRENILAYTLNAQLQTQPQPAPVPAPAGVLILLSGLLGVMLLRRKN
jgi:hypothetical protein